MDNQQFETVVTSEKPRGASLRELIQYRDLVWLFVKRNFVNIYKQSILGPLWILLNPLMTSVVYTFIFGQMAGLSTDGTPQFLFYLAGSSLWGFFSATLTGTANTFVDNAGIFSKVYFPRLVMPLSQMCTSLLNFLIQMLMFFVFYLYFFFTGSPIHVGPQILLLPLILVQVGLLGIACGLIIASLTTKYRDLAYIVTFGVQLWMYVTPVVYPFSSLGGITRAIVSINPMTFPVEIFRYALLGSGTPDYGWWGVSLLLTLIVSAIGLRLFSRIETTFIDTV